MESKKIRNKASSPVAVTPAITGAIDTGEKRMAGVVDTGNKQEVANISPNFHKNLSGPNRYSSAWGKLICEKVEN